MSREIEIEDGMGFAGLLPTRAERDAERHHDQRVRSLIIQRDSLIQALRAAAAHLDQPALHTDSDTTGAANILRADSKAALLLIRAALRRIEGSHP